jgi:hypothetical protein
MNINIATYIILIPCRVRCLCLQGIYIPRHVNRNYKAHPLDSLFKPRQGVLFMLNHEGEEGKVTVKKINITKHKRVKSFVV